MPVIERDVVIDAPAEEVFAIIEDPERLPEYMAGVTGVADVVRTPGRVGDSYTVTYSVLGMHFPTKVSIIEWEQNRAYVEKMEGSMPGTSAVNLHSKGNGTKVTWKMDYSIKGGVLGKAMNRLLLERMNVKTIERSLENLKMICDAARE